MTVSQKFDKIISILREHDKRFDAICGRLNVIEKDLRETRELLEVEARLENIQTIHRASRPGGPSPLPLAAKSTENT